MDKIDRLVDAFSNISFNPFSDEETIDIKQTVTQVSEVILNSDDVPVFNEIKVLAEELPNIDDIMLSITGVPSIEDVQVSISELPNIDDIMLSIMDIPDINDIKVSIMDIPDMGDIGVDNLVTLQGLSSDQDTTSNSVENISRDNSSTNTQSKVSVGDIKINVTGINDNPSETGKIIAKALRSELEPLFRQASQDLNSAVEL